MVSRAVFYGAGEELDMFFANNPVLGFKIVDIVDSRKAGQEFYGYCIRDKGILKELSPNTVVVISSKKYFDEIYGSVHELNPRLQCLSLESVMKLLSVIGYCNICGERVRYWQYCGNHVSTKYRIAGNGRRIGCCPDCFSSDRNRWVYFVLKNYTRLFEDGGAVLHFAPEKQIEAQIRKNTRTDYITADIMKDVADYTVDMTKMPFEDGRFDYIIANHVLEHISDEGKAITELKRCIGKKGKIILSFPVSPDTDTFEISGLSGEERTYYYGQDDHVRLYGRDFKERLESYGLTVEVFRPCTILSAEMINEIKVQDNDVVMICSIGLSKNGGKNGEWVSLSDNSCL